ncbi:unnamed protein product [Auanema sp. JU1783]|nr:unnamed protein product [Auanema sp. JU1783]
MVIWPEITQEDGHFLRPKPRNWREKHLGQWCRNFTIHKHTQCPEATMFHEYHCCGDTSTECCFAVQGWLYVVGGISSITTTAIFIFYLLLKMNKICLPNNYTNKPVYVGGQL